ncbi:MAG: CDP-glucose 4,6-dehydratase [Myxococcales bacterium]|nr:MAG: CDP-glucose 4,6-dehydratase [Myxococcales bacterium]
MGLIDKGFWNNRRVLVTGHTGFKGTWLSVWLKSMGAQVAGLALAPQQKQDMFNLVDLPASLDLHEIGDIRDAHVVRISLANFEPEVVFHLAAQPIVRQSYRDPLGTYATNVMGTAHVLDAIVKTKSVKAALIVTTDKVYTNEEWLWGYRENDRLGGKDPYSSSKACAELITHAYRESYAKVDGYKLGLASARAGNVLGGGDWSADRIVPDMVRAFLKNEAVVIRNPASTRPWQHVIDPLRGYLRLAEKLYHCATDYSEAWNFGPEAADAVSVKTLAGLFAQAWGDAATIDDEASISGVTMPEANFLKLDHSKASSRLNWFPAVQLAQCVLMTADWYKAADKQPSSKELWDLTCTQIAEAER